MYMCYNIDDKKNKYTFKSIGNINRKSNTNYRQHFRYD